LATPEPARAFLDHQHDAGADRIVEFETEMSATSMKHSTEGFGGDPSDGEAGTLRRHQNPPMRFWIISMMLVLIGLSSLKPR